MTDNVEYFGTDERDETRKLGQKGGGRRKKCAQRGFIKEMKEVRKVHMKGISDVSGWDWCRDESGVQKPWPWCRLKGKLVQKALRQ